MGRVAAIEALKYAYRKRSEGTGMVENELKRPTVAEPHLSSSSSLEEDDDSVDLIEVFHRLRRGMRTVLKVTLATFLIATAVAFILPFRYTSTTSFVPPMMSSSSSMASMVAGQLSALGAGDLLGQKNPGELYSGILKSHSIADKLIKDFDLLRVYKVKKEKPGGESTCLQH